MGNLQRAKLFRKSHGIRTELESILGGGIRGKTTKCTKLVVDQGMDNMDMDLDGWMMDGPGEQAGRNMVAMSTLGYIADGTVTIRYV